MKSVNALANLHETIFKILPTDRNVQTEMNRQTNGWTDKTDGHVDIALPILAHMPGVIILLNLGCTFVRVALTQQWTNYCVTKFSKTCLTGYL